MGETYNYAATLGPVVVEVDSGSYADIPGFYDPLFEDDYNGGDHRQVTRADLLAQGAAGTASFTLTYIDINDHWELEYYISVVNLDPETVDSILINVGIKNVDISKRTGLPLFGIIGPQLSSGWRYDRNGDPRTNVNLVPTATGFTVQGIWNFLDWAPAEVAFSFAFNLDEWVDEIINGQVYIEVYTNDYPYWSEGTPNVDGSIYQDVWLGGALRGPFIEGAAAEPASVFLDSCEKYSNATDIGYMYPTKSNATISRTYYRVRQEQSIALAADGYIQKELPLDSLTIIMGAAVYLPAYPASDKLLFQMRDGSSEAIGLYVSSTGMPKAKSGATTFITGTTAIETGKFVYIELMAIIDNASGIVKLWVHNTDETYDESVTAQDTNRTANGIVDNVRWIGTGAGSIYITQMYCYYLDTADETVENFGNIEIHAYKPIQDVINIGCEPNIGLTLTNTVDEILPVTSDYIYFTADDSPADKYRLLHEAFRFPNPSTPQEILAVQSVGLLANGNADSPPVNANFSFFWGYGSNTGNSDTQTVIADDAWLYYTQGYLLSPATDAAWANEDELNDFTWGIEKA